MSTLQKATLLLASSGMTLDSQVPCLWAQRTVGSRRGIEIGDLVGTRAINLTKSMPVCVRVTVDPELLNKALGSLLAILARISLVSAEVARSVDNNTKEMKLLWTLVEVVALNNLVEATCKF